MTAIEDGLYQPAMKARMEELERQKAEIGVRLREMPPDLPDVNPNVAELYRVQVVQLAAALQEPDVDAEAAGAIRSLIGAVAITPGEKRGHVNALLRGDLMGILELAASRGDTACQAQAITTAVAGPRFEPSRDRGRDGMKKDLTPDC